MTTNEDTPRRPDGDVPVRTSIPRFGRVDEVAKMMLFIAAEATYSTGSEFVLDGGLTAGRSLEVGE